LLLRPYRPDDWPRLCHIHDRARKDELGAAGLLDAFLTLEQTAEAEGLFAGEVIVAEVDGTVEGFVAHSENELTWLYANPSKYRKGIGRALLRRAIEAAAGTISTEVLVGNEVALSLYLSEGFQVIEQVNGRLTGNEAFPASGLVLERRSAA
jgi:ribosomal protein S18 acetylase RimI-like enzyme